jgi:hypothetical protein
LHIRMIRRRAGGQADSGWISPQAADRARDRRIGIVRRRGGLRPPEGSIVQYGAVSNRVARPGDRARSPAPCAQAHMHDGRHRGKWWWTTGGAR